jgi:hypothetical protein
MALVIRGDRIYAYKSVRKGGRVTSEYCGSGECAALIGRWEAIEHERRRDRAYDIKARRDELEAEDEPIIAMFRAVEIVARAYLESRGCYLHRGHEWRRRRTVSATTRAAAAALGAPLPPPEIGLDELWKRARKGDKKVLPQLRALLDRRPELLRNESDMAKLAEFSMAIIGTDLIRQEALVRELGRVAEELAGEGASPVVRLLARRASLCWHAVNRAELSFAWESHEGVTLAHSDYLQRRIDGAHRRFLQSVKMLEVVRRLARPGPSVAVSVAQSVTVEAPAAARQARDDPPLMA